MKDTAFPDRTLTGFQVSVLFSLLVPSPLNDHYRKTFGEVIICQPF